MRRIAVSLVKRLYYILFLCLGKLPSKKGTIIFESFLGKQYSDNPRAIYEYLELHYPEYKMYWSIEKGKTLDFQKDELNVISRLSLKWIYKMARAEYWVTNSRLPLWIPKPKNTIYLQTWHGTPLKKLANDMEEVYMPGTNTTAYKKNFTFEASKWDYLISPNEYSTEIFKRAFCFNKSVVESGYPRNDYLIDNMKNDQEITRIKDKCVLPRDKKVILYAPTWRDNQFYGKGQYKFDLNLDLEILKKELAEDYIIILRLHYLVAENLDIKGYEDFIYDFSKHEDIRELYLIADMLVTDYSSVFFDYANLKRPMIFYVYDIDEYRDKLRGFYFDFEKEAPGPLVRTTAGLIHTIKKIESNKQYEKNYYKTFYEKFCSLEDGDATKRVVDKVINKN